VEGDGERHGVELVRDDGATVMLQGETQREMKRPQLKVAWPLQKR
jgi:hypothetical protein